MAKEQQSVISKSLEKLNAKSIQSTNPRCGERLHCTALSHQSFYGIQC